MTVESESVRSFDQFLTSTMRRHWEASETPRSDFLAFLLAAPEAWQVAWDETTKDGYAKPALAGALSVAGLSAVLRMLATGPLGLVLTGLSAGALAAVYAAEQSAIVERSRAVRRIVERFRVEFADLAAERDRRSMRDSQWEVVVDSLARRFLDEVDAAPGEIDPASMGGFAEHVVGPSMPPRTSKPLGGR